VSALAWNEAIKAAFAFLQDFFPAYEGRLAETIVLFLYALLVTAITVFAIRRLQKFQKKIKPEVKKESKKKA
jgi:hypothetical protein